MEYMDAVDEDDNITGTFPKNGIYKNSMTHRIVQAGESYEEAAKREFFEEVGKIADIEFAYKDLYTAPYMVSCRRVVKKIVVIAVQQNSHHIDQKYLITN